MPYLLSQSDASRILGVSVEAIKSWRKAGYLRMESEAPPRATLAAYSEAAATARWAPRTPVSQDDIERWTSDICFHLGEARVRGIKSYFGAVLACAELGGGHVEPVPWLKWRGVVQALEDQP